MGSEKIGPIDGDKLVGWLKDTKRTTISAHGGAYSYIISTIESGHLSLSPPTQEERDPLKGFRTKPLTLYDALASLEQADKSGQTE